MNDEIEPPDISPPTTKERLLAAGEFGLALAGGPAGIASYYIGRASRSRTEGVPEFLHAVAARLDSLEEAAKQGDATIDAHIEEILERAWSKKQRETRDYWAAAAAHTAAGDLDAAERGRMIDTLDALRLSHLSILHRVASEDTPDGWTNGNMDSFLMFGIPGADIQVIRLDWNDLLTAGILGSYPSGVTSTSHHILARQAIPPLGRRFIAFIEA